MPTSLALSAVAPAYAALSGVAWYGDDRTARFSAPLQQAAADQGIAIEFQPQPKLDQLITAVVGGSAPDVIAVHSSSTFPSLVNLKALRPLDPAPLKGIVPPELLSAFEVDGRLYAIPATAELEGTYVNLTLLAEAGLAAPTANWNWNDLAQMAKKVTKDTNGDGTPDIYGTAMRQYEQEIGPFIYANGGSYMNAQLNGTEVTFDSPATVAALEFWRSLIHDYNVALFGWEKTAFLNGKIGFFFDGTWDIGTAQRTIGSNFDWDFIPYPVSPTTGKRSTRLAEIGLSVSAATKSPDDAVRVAQAAANKPVQESYLQTALNAVPVRADLFNSPYLPSTSQAPRSARAAIMEMITQGEAVPETVYPDPQMVSVVQNAIASVFKDDISAQTAAQQADAQMTALLQAALKTK